MPDEAKGQVAENAPHDPEGDKHKIVLPKLRQRALWSDTPGREDVPAGFKGEMFKSVKARNTQKTNDPVPARGVGAVRPQTRRALAVLGDAMAVHIHELPRSGRTT